MQLGFNAKAQRPKDAKVKGGNGSLTNDHRLVAWTGVGKILFALQYLRITHVREDFFSRRERGERGATTGKEIRQGLFLRALCACAHRSLPARFWLRRAVPGRGI